VCEKTKPTIKFITKMQRDFKQRGCEGMTMELKEEGSGACCGAF
jgi:hypothetical protein